jgi:hypothetical protein
MELEVIEPELFQDLDPLLASRAASELLNFLRGATS